MLQKITTTLFLYLNLQHKTKPIFKIMINLEKGQRVTIDLPKFTIGLGWDTNSSDTGSDFDLDAGRNRWSRFYREACRSGRETHVCKAESRYDRKDCRWRQA